MCIRPLPLVFLALLAAALVGGCGDDARPPDPSGGLPAGPPRWRRVRADASPEATAVSIEVRSPARFDLVTEGFESEPKVIGSRDVTAGQVVRLEWYVDLSDRPTGVPATPPPEAQAEGRREMRTVDLAFGWQDRTHTLLKAVTWTRPGRGFTQVVEVPPPGAVEDLPWDAEIELVAVLVGDGSREVLRARRKDDRSVLALEGAGPEDRARLLRLTLRVEPR